MGPAAPELRPLEALEQGWEAEDLTDVVDFHVHASPDLQPRVGDDLDYAREASAALMRAIVLKSHHAMTTTRAYLAEKAVGSKLRVFGGLTLGLLTGGLNPGAVDIALKLGSRFIWMPTRYTRHHQQYFTSGPLAAKGPNGGVRIVDDTGQPCREIVEIVDLVAKADAILATSHLSPKESLTLVRLARERGVKRMVVTHPDIHFLRMPIEIQRECVRLGAFMERTYIEFTPNGMSTPLEHAAETIRAVGVASTILATDLGIVGLPWPVEGMRRYIAGLRALGFTQKELTTMTAANAAQLLDLA